MYIDSYRAAFIATPATVVSIDGSNAFHQRPASLPFDEYRRDGHRA